jgi:hypothetical protein
MTRLAIGIGVVPFSASAIVEPLNFYNGRLFIDLDAGTSILKKFLITTGFNQDAVWLQPVGRSN